MLLDIRDDLNEWVSALPQGLISDVSAGALDGFLRRFPSLNPHRIDICDLGILGLELRLGDAQDQVDLLVPDSRDDGDRILAACHGGATEAMLSDPHWERLMQLFIWWRTTDDVLGRSRILWLEFDVAEDMHGNVPTPNVFVQIMDDARAPEAVVDRRRKVLYLSSLTSILSGGQLSQALRERVEQCLACLPVGGFLKFVGLMLDRSSGLRLCIDGVRRKDWAGYLNSIERGLGSMFEDVVFGRLLPAGQTGGLELRMLNLDVDTAGHIGPTLGPEFHFRGPERAEVDFSAFRPLLSRLEIAGLVSRTKGESLGGVSTMTPLVFRGRRIWRVRKLNHVKVVIVDQAPVAAKAYLGQTVAGLRGCRLSFPPPAR